MTNDGYLTIKEYAERNHVSASLVRNRLNLGKIHNSIFRNRRWLIPATEPLDDTPFRLPVTDSPKAKTDTFNGLRNKIYKGEANTEEITRFTNMVLELKTAGAVAVLDGNVYTLKEIDALIANLAATQVRLDKFKAEQDARTSHLYELESELSVKAQTLSAKETIVNSLLVKSSAVKQWCYESVALITSKAGKVDLPDFPIDPKDVEAWDVAHKPVDPDEKEFAIDGIEDD